VIIRRDEIGRVQIGSQSLGIHVGGGGGGGPNRYPPSQIGLEKPQPCMWSTSSEWYGLLSQTLLPSAELLCVSLCTQTDFMIFDTLAHVIWSRGSASFAHTFLWCNVAKFQATLQIVSTNHHAKRPAGLHSNYSVSCPCGFLQKYPCQHTFGRSQAGL